MISRLLCLSIVSFVGIVAGSQASAQTFLPLGTAVVPVAPVFASPYVAARPVIAPTYSAGFAPSPYTARYAAAYAAPVSVYRPAVVAAPIYQPAVFGVPAVVRTKVYVPGQPLRNFARAITP